MKSQHSRYPHALGIRAGGAQSIYIEFPHIRGFFPLLMVHPADLPKTTTFYIRARGPMGSRPMEPQSIEAGTEAGSVIKSRKIPN